MCTCYNQNKQLLLDHYKDTLPAGSANLDVELQGYVFGMSNEGVSHRAACAVRIEYQAPRKDAGMKTVKQKSFLRATYCPFCGVNYDEPTKAAD